jgi:hypothetical protein
MRALARIEGRHLARSPLLWLGVALAVWPTALNLRSEWPTLSSGGALIAYQNGFLIGAGAVWAGAWLGLRDRVSGAADLVTVTPTAPWRLWGARLASVAAPAAGAFALLSAATLAVFAADGGRGMPDLRLLADGALAVALSGLVGLAVGRLSGSRTVALLAGPVWFLACMLAADPGVSPTPRLAPSLLQEWPRSVEFGFVPDPFWPHLGYLLGLVLLVGVGLLTLVPRGSGQRPPLAPVLAAVVAGLVLVGAGGARLVALPERLVMLGPDRADWKPVAEADEFLSDPSFAYPDDGRATACAGDATLRVCVYPAYGTELAQRVHGAVRPVAGLLVGLPGVPTRIRMVPETFGTCHGGEVQMEEGMLSAPLPNRASAGSYLTCALGQGDQPERFDNPARDHEPSVTPASDVRDAVRLWALMAGGVVTSQELQRVTDTDAWELGIVSTSPWAAVAPALAMAELPADQVRVELAPAWDRMRAGTLPVAELPGQRP